MTDQQPSDANPSPTLAEQSVGISQPHLAHQDATKVDPFKLTALTPEVVRYMLEVFAPLCDIAQVL